MTVPDLIGKYELNQVSKPAKEGLPDLLNTKYGLNAPVPVVQQSTLGKVGNFIKPIAQDIYSTAATIPVRAAQAEELVRTSFFGSPSSQTKAQEFATQPVNIGFGTTVKPLDTSSIGRAAQQTAGDIIKLASLTPIGKELSLAKQMALQGGTYALGSGLSEGKSPIDIAKETALGTAGGAVFGKGLSVLGGAKVASELAKKTDAQLLKEAEARANLGPIPEASTPKLSLPAPRTPSETPIQLPSKGILKGQQLLREGQPTEIPTTSKVATPSYITQAKKTPKVSKVENITPAVEPNITTTSPEFKVAAENTFKATTPPETYIPGNEKTWIDAASKDIQFAKDVVFGRANPELGVPKNAYFSVLKNIAEDTGDTALIDELKLANPARTSASVGAQELRATQLTGKDNIVDVLYKIETDRYSQLSKNMQKLVDQEGTNATKKIMEDISNFKPTNELIDKITNILTCK